MKPYTKNPVLSGPWVSNMPNNFLGRNKMINDYSHFPQMCQQQKLGAQPRKVSKAMVTKIYAEELLLEYPFLTKTQIKAALVLMDNDLYGARMIINMKYKFVHLKASLLNSHQYFQMINASPPQNTAATEAEDKVDTSDSSSTITKSSNETSSFSSVYDFSDSEPNNEPLKDWFEYRKNVAKQYKDPRKVGVIIMKDQNGYKAYPL